MTTGKHLITRKEAVLTIANGDLEAVVWRTAKDGRLVLYVCREATMDEYQAILSKDEVAPILEPSRRIEVTGSEDIKVADIHLEDHKDNDSQQGDDTL